MTRIDVLESLLAQIHELSAPRPRLSVTRTAEQLADQLIAALRLHPEHHGVLVSTLMDYAAQSHGWRPADAPPPPWSDNRSADVPAAVNIGGNYRYAFVCFNYLRGAWCMDNGEAVEVAYWYDLPALPD